MLLSKGVGGDPTEPKHFWNIFERGIDPHVDDPQTCHHVRHHLPAMCHANRSYNFFLVSLRRPRSGRRLAFPPFRHIVPRRRACAADAGVWRPDEREACHDPGHCQDARHGVRT